MNKFLVVLGVLATVILMATAAMAPEEDLAPPEVFESSVIDDLKGYADNPGVAETYFTTKPLYSMCTKARALLYQVKMPRDALMDYNCFVFFHGDVVRTSAYIEYQGMKLNIQPNSTFIVLNGKFIDTRSGGAAGPSSQCYAITYEGKNAMVIWGRTSMMPLSACEQVTK